MKAVKDFLPVTKEDMKKRGWQQADFDCSGWTPVAKRPGPPASPWKGFNPKNYVSIQAKGEIVNVKLIQRKKITADVRFTSKKGFRGDEKFSECGIFAVFHLKHRVVKPHHHIEIIVFV